MTQSEYLGGLSVEEVASKVGGKQIYKLSSNENPLGPSPLVVEAIKQAAEEVNIYPPRTDAKLVDALVAYHGRGLSAENIVTSNSGCDVIELIHRAFVTPDDEIIISSPTFGIYNKFVNMLGGRLVDVPLDPDTFTYDVDAVLAAVTEKTRLVYVCNPNNPTGTVTAQAPFRRLLDSLPERVIVVADEVYYQFVQVDMYPDTIEDVLADKQVIIVHSFSKAFAMAGVRLGYGIGKPALIAKLRRFDRPFLISKVDMAAGMAALQDGDHMARSIAAAHAGLSYLEAAFDRLGVHYWPSEANFVLIETRLPAGTLVDHLLTHGIMVRDPRISARPNAVRVSVGTRAGNEALVAALEAILAPVAVG